MNLRRGNLLRVNLASGVGLGISILAPGLTSGLTPALAEQQPPQVGATAPTPDVKLDTLDYFQGDWTCKAQAITSGRSETIAPESTSFD